MCDPLRNVLDAQRSALSTQFTSPCDDDWTQYCNLTKPRGAWIGFRTRPIQRYTSVVLSLLCTYRSCYHDPGRKRYAWCPQYQLLDLWWRSTATFFCRDSKDEDGRCLKESDQEREEARIRWHWCWPSRSLEGVLLMPVYIWFIDIDDLIHGKVKNPLEKSQLALSKCAVYLYITIVNINISFDTQVI
jgi:hypothetical protein